MLGDFIAASDALVVLSKRESGLSFAVIPIEVLVLET
jgi:hypothetical protein